MVTFDKAALLLVMSKSGLFGSTVIDFCAFSTSCVLGPRFIDAVAESENDVVSGTDL